MQNEERDIKAVNEFLASDGDKTYKNDGLLRAGDLVKCKGCPRGHTSGEHIGKTFRVEDDEYLELFFCFFDVEAQEVVSYLYDYAYFELVTES